MTKYVYTLDDGSTGTYVSIHRHLTETIPDFIVPISTIQHRLRSGCFTLEQLTQHPKAYVRGKSAPKYDLDNGLSGTISQLYKLLIKDNPTCDVKYSTFKERIHHGWRKASDLISPPNNRLVRVETEKGYYISGRNKIYTLADGFKGYLNDCWVRALEYAETHNIIPVSYTSFKWRIRNWPASTCKDLIDKTIEQRRTPVRYKPRVHTNGSSRKTARSKSRSISDIPLCQRKTPAAIKKMVAEFKCTKPLPPMKDFKYGKTYIRDGSLNSKDYLSQIR